MTQATDQVPTQIEGLEAAIGELEAFFKKRVRPLPARLPDLFADACDQHWAETGSLASLGYSSSK